MTGQIVQFPPERYATGLVNDSGWRTEPCLILILPVVRIERCDDGPDESPRHRRRP